MNRHPWTNADDFIRSLGPVGPSGVVLSRSDATQLIQGMARAIGWSAEELAIKLSEAQQGKSESDYAQEAERLVRALGY